MGDSESSAHQQCVYGVGENWNARYCSFSVLLWCAVTRRRWSGGKNSPPLSTKQRAASILMRWLMLNLHARLRSPPPLFTLLPQGGFSTVTLPACLCKSCSIRVVAISVSSFSQLFIRFAPSRWRSRVWPWFPAGEESGVVPSYESHVSGEQRGRQRAERDAVPAGEAGEHGHSGRSALRPAGWAQRTGTMSV